jgi:hypothetical protein
MARTTRLVALLLPGISSDWALVDFLLDTGASNTSLHPKDAQSAMGIDAARLQDPTQWTNPLYPVGISGPCPYFREPARYALRHDNGQWQVFNGDISVAQLLPGLNETIPSLLGWNILQHFTVTLDWSQREIRLV